MHSNHKKYLLIFILKILLVTYFFCCSSVVKGEIKDSIVAYVDNIAITYSELKERYYEILKSSPDIRKEEVLNTMINRILLIREAKKLGLDEPSDDELVNTYIELKIKTFIRIKDKEVKQFYEANIDKFYGKDFEDVREEIEKYLIEVELNKRLKEYINEMREKACIKIKLEGDELY